MLSRGILEDILFVCGWLHFSQLIAMLTFAPRMLQLREETAKLSPVVRAIFGVLVNVFTYTVTGLGVVVVFCSKELAGGSRLANCLCLFMGIFFGLRTLAQIKIYRKVWPDHAFGRISNWGLTCLLGFLAVAYCATSVIGWARPVAPPPPLQ